MNEMKNAPLVPITDVLSFIVDNRGKTVPTAESGFPLIATNCVHNERLYPVFENIRYVSEYTLHNWFRAELKANDILFVNKGTPGRCCLVPDPVSFCAAQDMIGLRCDEQKVYYRYLLMVLRSTTTQKFISNYHVGIAIPHFKKEDLSKLLIPLPSMEYQKRIGDLYFDICEKEEHNNSICADLEAMAKLLYDYWFVQFDFPDENGKPYKSSGGKMVWNEELKREIPKNWEIVTFGDILSFTKGRIPDELSNEKTEQMCSPYVTIDVANGSISQYCNPKSMVLCNGETIMVMDGAASGDVYIGNVGSLGSTFSMLPSKRNDISDSLIYMLLKGNMTAYKRANTGSTVPHANRTFIEKMKIALPLDCSFYSEKFDLIIEKELHSKAEISQLASLRDFLLPMLMNGQVKVNE